MLDASIGGGAAARCGVYRHAIAQFMKPVLAGLQRGPGWSDWSLALGALLMVLQAAPTLRQRFAATLVTLDLVLPRRQRTGRTYQGFIKTLTRHGPRVAAELQARGRDLCRQVAGARWMIAGFVVFAADGSTVDAPRTIGNEPLGTASKRKSGPQMLAVLLVHLGTMIPWAWKCDGVRGSERSLLRSMLGTLPDNSLIVADAGFTGYELLRAIHQSGVRFVVRVGGNVRLLRELGCYRRQGKDTVYLWPDAAHKSEPLVLRLVRVGDVYLITDVLESTRLSKKAVGELYRIRWGVEVSFRNLKQTMERSKVRSCTAQRAFLELEWMLLAMQVVAVVGVAAVVRAGYPPRRWSIAATIETLRHAQHARLSWRAVIGRLRRCIQDGYTRLGSKKSYQYARKKQIAALQPPKITRATRSEVLQAKAVRAAITVG